MESLDATYGDFGTDGRIVDFQLLLDGLELSNFEFEVCGLSEQEYKRQYLKNIRFHRSIMEQHFGSKGIRTKLYFMCFQGKTGSRVLTQNFFFVFWAGNQSYSTCSPFLFAWVKST